jgi:hypothetical protein
MLNIHVTETGRGLLFRHGRKRYALTYPEGVWSRVPAKLRAVITDHLAHLLTMDVPMIAREDGVTLNRPRPAFGQLGRILALGTIPGAVEAYAPSTAETLARHRALRYVFSSEVPALPPRRAPKVRDRAIVLFSSGKDSLASLGLAREMGLDPVALYIDDTTSPPENRIKRRHLRRVAKMGVETMLVTNRVERLNDFANWTGEESCLGYMHMVTTFALVGLVAAVAKRARFIVIGNQQNMNFPFVNKDGFRTVPFFDQTTNWTLQIDRMTRAFTADTVRTMSLIEPLTDVGVMKLLIERYPDLAELMVCCDSLDASDQPRWCMRCPKCARLGLMMHALGFDPDRVSHGRVMLDEGDAPYYPLFGGHATDNYERPVESVEEQELCFLLAMDRGLAGPLVERFQREFGRRRRKKKLLAKFLQLYPPATVPVALRQRLMGLLKDAVGQER